MRKISLLLPPQTYQLNEVKLKDINKDIKYRIVKKYKQVFKKKFIWKKNFINKNFNKYDVNTVLLVALILSKKKISRYSLFAGISIGEYLSLYFAGILTLDETIDIVLKRSKILYDENKINPGFMISIYGHNIKNFKKIIKSKNLKKYTKISLIFSNYFFCISVTKKMFKKLINILALKGINFTIIKNNGPWHSSLILKSKKKIEKLINSYNYKFNNRMLSNYTGKKHKNLKDLKKNLIHQTFNVIRWDKNLDYIEKNFDYFSSPFPVKTIQKIIYLTKSSLKEI